LDLDTPHAQPKLVSVESAFTAVDTSPTRMYNIVRFCPGGILPGLMFVEKHRETQLPRSQATSE